MFKIEPTNLGNLGVGGGAHFLYIQEQEHKQKISGVIKELNEYFRRGGDPNDIFFDAIKRHGLTVESLTASERDKINKETFK